MRWFLASPPTLGEGVVHGGFSLSSSASWGGVSSSPQRENGQHSLAFSSSPQRGEVGRGERGEGGEGEQQTGADPTLPLAEQLAPLWGQLPRRVVWPLSLKVGRIPS